MHSELLSFDQLPASFVQSVKTDAAAETHQAQERKKRSGLFTASELHKLLTSKAKPAQNATARGYICEKAWERMTGCAVEKGTGFRETDWGNEWEEFAIETFAKTTGLTVEYTGKHQKFQRANGYPFGATLDGLIGNDGIVEVKCPFNGGIHLQNVRFGNDLQWFIENRFDYYVQIQGGLWASDRQKAWFISYDPGTSRERSADERITFEGFPEKMRLFYTVILRDEEFIDTLKIVVEAAEKELQGIICVE